MKVYRTKSTPVFARKFESRDDADQMFRWLESNADAFGITDLRFVCRPALEGDDRYHIRIELETGSYAIQMKIQEYAVFYDGNFSCLVEEAFNKVFEEVPAS